MARSCPLRVFRRYFMGTPSAQESLKAVSKTFKRSGGWFVSQWVSESVSDRVDPWDAYASKNGKASFQEQRFFWEAISSKQLGWSKAQIINIQPRGQKRRKWGHFIFFNIKSLRSGLTFIVFGLLPRYWRFLLLSSLYAWLKSTLRKIFVSGSWHFHF